MSSENTEEHVVMRFPRPGRLLRALLPDEAVQHLYAARREQLLAIRSIVDAAIDRVDTHERDRASRRTQ
jgi:hypothetical protein